MNSKLILCLALVLSGGLFGGLQTKAGIGVPVVAAPAMHQCREAKVKDLGVWDDALRFSDLDMIVLRKKDALFSYSLVTGRLKEIYVANNLTGFHLIDGITWEKHQWVFCRSEAAMPFAIDLADGKKVTFEIPGVSAHGLNGPNIHAIINAGFEPETIVAITGDEAPHWPREGNWPLFYWMNLESGKVMKFPTGWDLNYFSADQRRAVFESISTNTMMYRPWVTVDMATGDVTEELPDRTKALWSSMSGFWQTSFYPWGNHDYRRYAWELRSPQTRAKLLHPQVGRGYADDIFAGLSVSGVEYPLTMPGIGTLATCLDAKVADNLAVFAIANDGHTKEWLWAVRLDQNEAPQLLATNSYDFEMLGDQRCALLVRNQLPAVPPMVFVYDVESNAAWNVLDGVPLKSGIEAHLGNTNGIGTSGGVVAYGAGPMVAFRLIPGFGSARYPAEALCLCSTANVVPANVIPPPVQRMTVLLTAQGRRYQVHLPSDLRDVPLDFSWLHNSGKLVINQSRHLYVADLRADKK